MNLQDAPCYHKWVREHGEDYCAMCFCTPPQADLMTFAEFFSLPNSPWSR